MVISKDVKKLLMTSKNPLMKKHSIIYEIEGDFNLIKTSIKILKQTAYFINTLTTSILHGTGDLSLNDGKYYNERHNYCVRKSKPLFVHRQCDYGY